MADIAIDLGTANTLIQVKGKGVVLDEPSVVAVDRKTGRLVSAGLDAKRTLGRTPDSVVAVRPMRDGVIADIEKVELMLRHFVSRVLPSGLFRSKPNAVIGVPSGITELERRAVRQAVLAAGVRNVYLITEPMAAAVGVGLPVTTPTVSMVVNVGGGTTEIGVYALSGAVSEVSIRIGGNEMDEAIAAALRKSFNLLIGDATAEHLKMRLGSVIPLDVEERMEATGRDLVTGIPNSVEIDSVLVREWIQEPVKAIVEAVLKALEATPPELAGELLDQGFVLTGGGSLLRGLDRLLESHTGLQVHRDPEPMGCVVRGAGMVLDDLPRYRELLTT
jgi:rod shape-determining protein MreB and related proteins